MVMGPKSNNSALNDDNEEVQEVLCLIQGNDGKHLAFDRSYRLQLIEKPRQPPSKLITLKIMDPNKMFLLKRLSLIGCLYRILDAKSNQLSQCSNLFDGRIKQQFGLALRQELLAYCHFVTELYGNKSLTLLKLDVLLANMKRKFECLHRSVWIIEKINDEIDVLHELFDLTNSGDPLLDQTMINLFAFSMKPVTTIIRSWIMQKNLEASMTHLKLFNMSTNGKFELKTENFPKFLDSSLMKLISKFGFLMIIFKQMADKNELQIIESKLNSMFDKITLENLSMKNKPMKIYLFQNLLQEIYFEMNQLALEKLSQNDETFQITFQSIRAFFFQLFCSDLKPFHLDQYSMRMYDHQFYEAFILNEREITNQSILTLLINNKTNILLGQKSHGMYHQLYQEFYLLKSTLKCSLESWKEMRNFHESIISRWNYNIKPSLQKINWLLNQVIRILNDKEMKINWIILKEWNRFRKHLFYPNKLVEVIGLSHLHESFLKRILSEIKLELYQDSNYHTITKQMAQFRDKIQNFINVTNQTCEFEQGRWYEEKLENRQKYEKYVEKLHESLLMVLK